MSTRAGLGNPARASVRNRGPGGSIVVIQRNSLRHWLGLDVLSYTDPIGIAAILGLIGVIGLGVALMAATFYSARSGIDQQAGDARNLHYDDEPPQ